jgi:hypothetical protein
MRHSGLDRTVRVLVCALTAVAAMGATAQILGKADGDEPGTRIEVTTLKRVSGNQLMLQFEMINASSKPIGFGYNFIIPAAPSDMTRDDSTIAGIYLLDGTTKIAVARDLKGICVCSLNQRPVAPTSRRPLWARFPAPPDATTKLTVVLPHFQPVDDVPIQPTPPAK